MKRGKAISGSLILLPDGQADLVRNLRDPDECEPIRHADYGSGAYEDVSEAYDADAEVLAANLGWE